MKRERILRRLGVLAVTLLVVAGNPQPVEADGNANSIAGSYRAELDLGPLGTPRIEALYVILDQNGSVLFTSEHESDKEATSVGAWKYLPGGQIGLGAATFRYGPDPASSICDLVGVVSPPDNCVLKVGGTVSRQADQTLAGEMLLTVENLDGSAVITLPAALPIVMRRLTLADFPGALP